MGNRIFGCDDCQLVCPWNKFAKYSTESEFQPRTPFNDANLVTFFSWSEAEFLYFTQTSAIRRAGYIGWLRNIAVALGNATSTPAIIHALKTRLDHESDLVKEHVIWALQQHTEL